VLQRIDARQRPASNEGAVEASRTVGDVFEPLRGPPISCVRHMLEPQPDIAVAPLVDPKALGVGEHIGQPVEEAGDVQLGLAPPVVPVVGSGAKKVHTYLGWVLGDLDDHVPCRGSVPADRCPAHAVDARRGRIAVAPWELVGDP